MDNPYTICFYGSSDQESQESLAQKYETEIIKIIENVLSLPVDNIKVITGGYGGIMSLISQKIQDLKIKSLKNIEVIGISCDAFEFEIPLNDSYNSRNDLSKHNDVIIQAKNFAERIQAMIELSDLFIILPGKQGSLGELLLTYESYTFSKYLLNAKKAKLFVHDYWQPLLTNFIDYPQTQIPYFRNFDTSLLEYFNINNIDEKLASLKIASRLINPKKKVSQKSNSNIQHQADDFFIQKFQELQNNINKTILGRLLEPDGVMVLERLEKSVNSILGLDFGWFLTSQEKPNSGNYYTDSTSEYVNYTKEFFKSHNSIMLNEEEYKEPFKEIFLNGKHQTQITTTFSQGENIPKKESGKQDGSFNKLKYHFEKKEYGQTLLWRGFKVTDNGFVKQKYRAKANEIIFSVFILLNHKIPERTIEKIRQIIDDFLLTISSTKAAELFQEKEVEIISLATRAAISQVMARNMSHNIGSHVLSQFKDEEAIMKIGSDHNIDSQYIGDENLNKKNDLNGYNLIAYFNEYLKNRMDFLADIATTDPVMETPMYLFRDILRGFDKNRILLNRISGVSSEIKFKIVLKHLGDQINHLEHSKDPLLSIPNEILGAQAFYILLENIIRNIYKHGAPSMEIDITITVKEYERNASFYEISIYDNIVNKNLDATINNRNEAFEKSILENNSLRPNNLGTIEMDVCAAYLRCLPIISIEEDAYGLKESNAEGDKEETVWHLFEQMDIPRLIYAYKHQHNENDYSLGYKLYISKPKEILVVKDDNTIFNIGNGINVKELAKVGIQIINKEDLEKKSEIYNHQILYSLYYESELENILDKKQAMLPKRIIYSKNRGFNSAEEFIESVWEQYALKFFQGNSNLTYCIQNSNNYKYIKSTSSGINIEKSAECEKTESFSIIIDNHNLKWKDNTFNYYDMATSHSKINTLKDKIIWDGDKKYTTQYLEVIKTTVILLDERIQENISNNKRVYSANHIETPLEEYFVKQQIFIPTKYECDLNAVSFGILEEKRCKKDGNVSDAIFFYIADHFSPDIKPDFVVLHLGILEKMLPSGTDKNQAAINDVINILFGDNRKKLVLTSGRGKPHNIPDDIPYLPFALVQNAVETLFDKFLLIKILFNARKSV